MWQVEIIIPKILWVEAAKIMFQIINFLAPKLLFNPPNVRMRRIPHKLSSIKKQFLNETTAKNVFFSETTKKVEQYVNSQLLAYGES